MNCSSLLTDEYIPTMEEAVTALGELSVGLVVLGGVVTTGMFCVYIEELIYIYRHWPIRFFFLKLGCLSIFPIVGFCFFLNLLVPRATTYTTPLVVLFVDTGYLGNFKDILAWGGIALDNNKVESFVMTERLFLVTILGYLALFSVTIKTCLPAPLVLFFWVVVGYASKEKKLLEKLEDKLIPLRGPPCCCVCCCCPKLPFSKQRFKFVKASIYQFFLTPVLLFVIASICSHAGVYKELKFVPDNAAPYLMVLNFASFFIGVYGLVIFMKTTAKLLSGFHIQGKFLSLQLQFILIRFHFFTFDTLGRLGFFPCHPPVSSLVTALYIRSALLLGEGFILSVVGRFFFLHEPPIHFTTQGTAHPIS